MIWAGALVIIWALLWWLLTGTGLLIGRVIGGRGASRDEVPDGFWLGWAGTVAVLQPLQLLVPAGPWFLVLLVPPAAFGWRTGRRRDEEEDRPRSSLAGRLVAAATGCVVIVVALSALKGPELYDSYLYHLPAIRWARSFADVPGLANLNGRFGFACAHFPLAAVLEVGIGPIRGFHVLNGLFVVAFLSSVATRIRRLAPSGLEAVETYDLVSFVAPLFLVRLVSSPDTDVPLTLAGLVLGRFVLSLTPWRMAALPVIASAAVATKTTFAPFGAATLGTAVVLCHADLAAVRRGLLRAAPIVLLVASGWMARSAVLSGHLAFPFQASALAVDWRVPEDDVRTIYEQVRGWARAPDEATYRSSIHTWTWFPAWAIRAARDPATLPATVAIAGWGLMALRRRVLRIGPAARLSPAERALFGAASIAIVVWFLGAPDPRFARALFWTILALAMTGAAFQAGLSPRGRNLAAVAGLGLLVSWFLVRPGFQPGYIFPLRPLSARPEPPVRFPTRSRTLPSGLVLQVPALDDRCGDAPLPCTPYVDARLAARRSGDLSAGFRK